MSSAEVSGALVAEMRALIDGLGPGEAFDLNTVANERGVSLEAVDRALRQAAYMKRCEGEAKRPRMRVYGFARYGA